MTTKMLTETKIKVMILCGVILLNTIFFAVEMITFNHKIENRTTENYYIIARHMTQRLVGLLSKQVRHNITVIESQDRL